MTAHGPSNGTMSALWQDEWCERCANDHGFSHVSIAERDANKGCPHMLRMLVEDGPYDFLSDEHAEDEFAWDPRKLVCRWFERCPCEDEGGGDPPVAPIPVHPEQGLLFGGAVIEHERVERVNVGEWL